MTAVDSFRPVDHSGGTAAIEPRTCHPMPRSASSADPGTPDQAMSKRSRFITLFHAATKSRTNFSFESRHA
jgi:hypothetical protein